MKKCMTVKCPKCKHKFEACCLDYAEELIWYVDCSECGTRFPVKA